MTNYDNILVQNSAGINCAMLNKIIMTLEDVRIILTSAVRKYETCLQFKMQKHCMKTLKMSLVNIYTTSMHEYITNLSTDLH